MTVVCALLFSAGCGQEMDNQRRVEPQEATALNPSGAASRALPENVVPASRKALRAIPVGAVQADRRWLKNADADPAGGYFTGFENSALVDKVPPQALQPYEKENRYEQLLQRGRERFNISCAPCHDQTGSGNGMVARRGLKFPPTYHSVRLRSKPLGYFFNVATNGRGDMAAYGDYLSTDDRWAIAAYVRTLQFSQHAPADVLSSSDRKQLQPGNGAGAGRKAP